MSRVLIIIILDLSSVIHLESILGSAESFFVKSGLRTEETGGGDDVGILRRRGSRR